MKWRLVTSLVAVVALLLVGAPIAASGSLPTAVPVSSAAEEDVTWSVRPGDENGPDGRSWVELQLKPGDSAKDFLVIQNLGKSPAVFSLSAADGYFTATGRFNMLSPASDSVAAGTWIEIDDTIEVAPGETAIVPFTVVVPTNATPGDHAAGVAASVLSEATDSTGATVGIETRVGFRVMTRVEGVLSPAFDAEELSASYALSWNPLRPGELVVDYTLVNRGNARLELVTSVSVAPSNRSSEPSTVELLPGDARVVRATVDGLWPLGLLTGTVSVHGSTLPNDNAQTLAPATFDVVAWAFPAPQVVILLLAALLVTLWFLRRRRRSRQIAELVEQSRLQGAIDALEGRASGTPQS